MKIRSLLSNIIFTLQVLLLVLVLGEQWLAVPAILQSMGRMHPLLLHFPVVLVLISLAFQFMRTSMDDVAFKKINEILLYSTAFTTALTALMGLFLSREGGYGAGIIDQHKWTGISLSFITYFLLVFRERRNILVGGGIMASVLIIITGHLGATITHGQDFLIEPLLAKKVAFDPTQPVFDAVVMPIFDSKCNGCHNPQKKKGELDLTTWEGLNKGGEYGHVIVAGDATESDLAQRLQLPLDHDDHMPPEGKRQPTSDEIQIILEWINNGADPNIRLDQFDEQDTLFMLASLRLSSDSPEKVYPFKAANAGLIEDLNNPFRSIRQLTSGSPALDVQIFVREAYKEEYLRELSQISEQVVNLNLSYLPVDDNSMTIVAGFPNLEQLILNYTEITSAGLAALGEKEQLTSLALVGTPISIDIETYLVRFPALQEVYLWDTPLSESDIEEMRTKYPDIIFDSGYNSSADESLKISPPQLTNTKNVIQKGDKVELIHKLPDVSIFYTTDDSEPDSTSTLYEGPFVLREASTVRTRAYKKGWQPSDIAAHAFYIKGYTPERLEFNIEPDPQYRGSGPVTLVDDEKGDIVAFTTPRWLGYREKNFDVVADFGDNAPELGHISVSYGINMRSYIMKPVRVILYGGDSKSSMKEISRIEPGIPDDYEPNGELGINISTGSTSYRYYRIVAEPLGVLPDWHIGAGDKGWVFVDELFFY